VRRALLALIAAGLGAAAPALAAERVAPSSGPERIAFGAFLVGTIIFFAWVAWLARRR
jgi:hypothetical protein